MWVLTLGLSITSTQSELREEHLRLLNEAHKRGELVMASAFSEPVDGVRVRLSRRRRRGPNAFRRARSVRPQGPG